MKLIHEKVGAPTVPFVKTIRQKIGKDSCSFGTFDFGDYDYGEDHSVGREFDGVYQMRHCHDGIIPVKMKFMQRREQMPTVARLACRAKFRYGMSLWGALTPEQKEVYNKIAINNRTNGRSIFMKKHMLS